MTANNIFRLLAIVVGALSALQLIRSGLGFSLSEFLNALLNRFEVILSVVLEKVEPFIRDLLTALRRWIGDLDLQRHWKHAFILLWLFLGAYARTTTDWSAHPVRTVFQYAVAFLCAAAAGIAAGTVPLQHPSLFLWPVVGFFAFLLATRAWDAVFVHGTMRAFGLLGLAHAAIVVAAVWLAAQMSITAEIGIEVVPNAGLLALTAVVILLAVMLVAFGLPGRDGHGATWWKRRQGNPGRSMGLDILAVIGLAVLVVALVRVAPRAAEDPKQNVDGTWSDCDEKEVWCPQMVRFPTGTIQIDGRRVEVRAFALSETEVTWAQYNEFAKEVGYSEGYCYASDEQRGGFGYQGRRDWRQPGFAQGRDHPVVCISWYAAKAYVDWLRMKTGHAYRLPTDVEWLYAASTGVEFGLPWNSEEEGCAYGNFGSIYCKDRFAFTAPVKQFSAFGRDGKKLYDLFGNAWEWVEDCDAGADESDFWPKWLSPCSRRVLRGGSWNYDPGDASFRGRYTATFRSGNFGFRVARTY